MKGEGATDWTRNWKLIDIPRPPVGHTHNTQAHTHELRTPTAPATLFLVSIRLAYNAGPGYSTQHSHTSIHII